jgi:hypothetical protein
VPLGADFRAHRGDDIEAAEHEVRDPEKELPYKRQWWWIRFADGRAPAPGQDRGGKKQNSQGHHDGRVNKVCGRQDENHRTYQCRAGHKFQEVPFGAPERQPQNMEKKLP